MIKPMWLDYKSNERREQKQQGTSDPPTRTYHAEEWTKRLATAKMQSNTQMEHTEIWRLIK